MCCGAIEDEIARIRRYAKVNLNDLSNPDHLIAVKASANRSKGAKGPEDWLPPNEAYHCSYVASWRQIKVQWGLSMTEREGEAVAEILAGCP